MGSAAVTTWLPACIFDGTVAAGGVDEFLN
jgi:hypothetical protein